MTNPVSGDALTALVEQWRAKSDERLNLGGGHPKHSERTIATLRSCADELSALIAAGRSAATTVESMTLTDKARRLAEEWRGNLGDIDRLRRQALIDCADCADELAAMVAAGRSAPTRWTGLLAGFAPAETDRSTTNSGDTGGPVAEKP